MSVSDEDRELARVEAATAWVHKRWERCEFKDRDEPVAIKALEVIEAADSPWMRAMIDALVENAYWGPRPKASIARLAAITEQTRAIGLATGYQALSDYMRELGIELTD